MQLPWAGRGGSGNESLLPMANLPIITGDAADSDREGRSGSRLGHARTSSAHARVRLKKPCAFVMMRFINEMAGRRQRILLHDTQRSCCAVADVPHLRSNA